MVTCFITWKVLPQQRLGLDLAHMGPLRPFPFPFNVGTDICQISRIHKILVSPRAQRFVRRVLAPEEQQARTTFGLHAPDGHQQTQSLSAGLSGRDQELWKMASFIAGR
jgi:holo-[acyl-carrier protein] synthase